MWPYLFGLGWVWDVLVSAGLLAVIIAGAYTLLGAAARSAGEPVAAGDPLQTIWHRYEEGDLTRWEFERLAGRRRYRPLPNDAAAD